MKTVYEIISYDGIYMFVEPVRTFTLDHTQLNNFRKVQVPFLETAYLVKDFPISTTVEAYEIEGRLYVE